MRDNDTKTTASLLTAPAVHMNGTSKAELLDQLLTAFRAVQAASMALRAAMPHGRDYYVLDAGAVMGDTYTAARQQHNRRVVALDTVAGELISIATMIQDGQSGTGGQI